MTGRDLMNKLFNLSDEDLDKPVYMEGCDCYGECAEVYVDGVEINLNRKY